MLATVADTGTSFMGDLKARLKNKVQLTTEGHKAYLTAVSEVDFDADYAMLIKIFVRCARPLWPQRHTRPANCSEDRGAGTSSGQTDERNFARRKEPRGYGRTHRAQDILTFAFHHSILNGAPSAAISLVCNKGSLERRRGRPDRRHPYFCRSRRIPPRKPKSDPSRHVRPLGYVHLRRSHLGFNRDRLAAARDQYHEAVASLLYMANPRHHLERTAFHLSNIPGNHGPSAVRRAAASRSRR